MTTVDLWEETYSAVTVNRVRSGLTMLGIVIGIASVIALIAVGQGAQGSIQSSIQSLGSNLLIMTPGATRTFGSTVSAGRGSAQTLTPDDADAISSDVGNVAAVSPEVTARVSGGLRRPEHEHERPRRRAGLYRKCAIFRSRDGSFITDHGRDKCEPRGGHRPDGAPGSCSRSTTNASATPDMAIGQTIRISGKNSRSSASRFPKAAAGSQTRTI